MRPSSGFASEPSMVRSICCSTLPSPDDLPLEDLSVDWLSRAMSKLIEEQRRARPRNVEPNPPSVLERMTEILSVLRDTWSLLFSSLAGGERKRADIVVALLAVLELVRQGRIKTQQTELFGEIVIERQAERPDGEVPRAQSLGRGGGPAVRVRRPAR